MGEEGAIGVQLYNKPFITETQIATEEANLVYFICLSINEVLLLEKTFPIGRVIVCERINILLSGLS